MLPQRGNTLAYTEVRRIDILDYSEAALLLLRAVLNYILLLLPAVAVCMVAMRRSIFNTVQLGSIALAATALGGYCIFWSWFLSFRLVRPLGTAIEVASLVYIVLAARRLTPADRLVVRPLLAPAALVFTSALLLLAGTYAYGGLQNNTFITAGSRFSHQLPLDNEIPYTFAHSMMAERKVPIPIQGNWHASDRPPLQSAIVLSQYFGLIGPVYVAYEILSVLLQCLWIFGLWLLLYSLGINRLAISLVLAGSLFSNFILVNSVFVWPKLLAASYLLGFLALLLGGHLAGRPRTRTAMAVVAGALVAWSLLSHGGTAFACLGLLPLVILYRRSFPLKTMATSLITAALLYTPWILFQKFVDPPGDRLIKMHVAGIDPIDSRSAGQAILDSYRALSFSQIVDYKKQNLERIFDNYQFWPTLRAFLFELPKDEPARSRVRLYDAKDLNAGQFFFFPCTLGLYLLGIPLLLVGVFPQRRSNEWKAAVLLLAFTVVADLFWSLIMLGPATTNVHAGSYATVVVSFAAGILGLWAVSPWLAFAVTALQVALFTYIHMFLLVPYKATLLPGMTDLVVLGLVGTVYLLSSVAGRRIVLKAPSPAAQISEKVLSPSF